MKYYFHNLKQKIQRRKRIETPQKPKAIQSVHQQFFKRKHNLDYLQWMQQNSNHYVAAICMLAILLSVTMLWRQEPITDDKNVSFFYPPMETAALTAEEPTIAAVEQQPTEWIEVEEVILPDKVEAEKIVKEEPVYLNPLHLSGYQAPSSGMLQYNYGLGYDPIYEDYRFHNEICYAYGDGTVFACVNGEVMAVQMDQHWQLALKTQRGTVWYRGLETCNVTVNESVIAGQPIGTANNRLYIQAVKHD